MSGFFFVFFFFFEWALGSSVTSNQWGYRLNIHLRTYSLAKSCLYFLNMKSPRMAVLNVDGIASGVFYQSSHRCAHAQSCGCVWLFATPWTSPPGAFVHGIFQARILEWVAISSSRDLPDPEMEPTSPASLALEGRFFTTEPSGIHNNKPQ